MRTASHLLLTGVIGRRLQQRGAHVHLPALLLGSVLPDIPLALLSAGYKLVNARRGRAAPAASVPDRFDIGCHDLFHNDPLWIAGYGLFHAPLVIAALFLAGAAAGRRDLRWLTVGLALHSAVDVPAHHDDGPLLFFPLDWRYRWRSPLSYWDREHYGDRFAALETAMDLLLAAYLVREGVTEWLARSS
jgi:hypothetical protein